jgi:hypothetical protein
VTNGRSRGASVNFLKDGGDLRLSQFYWEGNIREVCFILHGFGFRFSSCILDHVLILIEFANWLWPIPSWTCKGGPDPLTSPLLWGYNTCLAPAQAIKSSLFCMGLTLVSDTLSGQHSHSSFLKKSAPRVLYKPASTYTISIDTTNPWNKPTPVRVGRTRDVYVTKVNHYLMLFALKHCDTLMLYIWRHWCQGYISIEWAWRWPVLVVAYWEIQLLKQLRM